jgi:elongation factor 2
MIAVKAHLPVASSFGFDADLRSATGGMAFSQAVFDHWELMDGSPLDVGSHLANTVERIRTRKGLEPKIPSLDRYLDKL